MSLVFVLFFCYLTIKLKNLEYEIKPLADRVLVEPLMEESSTGMSDTAKETTKR